jgi:two-component system OmpR family response regulator
MRLLYVRVLIVEDQVKMASLLRRALRGAGVAADVAIKGEDALWMAGATSYDALVLDVMLPGIDGFETCRRLRRDEVWTPVLMLTARDALRDRVAGLDGGADDYLTKPFAIAEFEARVRALLRRTSTPAGPLVFRGLTVDIEVKRVKVHDVAVDLTVREWALLELFLARPGRVLSKEQIAQQLANYDDALSLNTVEVYVSRLRSKIETEGVKIRTVRGFGYLWEAESV